MAHLPLVRPNLPSMGDLAPLIEDILRSGHVSNFGPLVSAFETAAAETFFPDEAVTCVTTNSGTAAIEIALQSLDLPPGSQIIVPAFSFCATAAAVLRLGHVPIFSDVDTERWEITVAIANQCVRRRKVAAVLMVSPFGYPVDTAQWAGWSRDQGIPVILDAAAGLGNQTRCDGLTVAFSMHATKPFAVGEGGLIAVTNSGLTRDLRARTNFGMIDRVAHLAGGNAKLSEWHGAIALAQLGRWHEIGAAIQRARRLYRESLAGLLLRFHPDAWTAPIAAFMPVGFPDEAAASVAILALNAAGVEARRWFYPVLPDHPAFGAQAARCSDNIECARWVADTTVCLPLHAFIDRADADLIANTLASIE